MRRSTVAAVTLGLLVFPIGPASASTTSDPYLNHQPKPYQTVQTYRTSCTPHLCRYASDWAVYNTNLFDFFHTNARQDWATAREIVGGKVGSDAFPTSLKFLNNPVGDDTVVMRGLVRYDRHAVWTLRADVNGHTVHYHLRGQDTRAQIARKG